MRIKETRTEELLALGMFGGGSRLGDRIERLLARGRYFSPRVSRARVSVSAIALLGCVIAGALAPRVIAFAQARPSFEVTSVKPVGPNNEQFRAGSLPGGGFAASNASLMILITFAYDVRTQQVSGGPGWLDSDKYDIEGRPNRTTPPPPGPAGTAQLRLMIQSLLEDRFKLRVHREMKEQPVFELAAVKGGPKVTEAVETAKGPTSGLRIGTGQVTGSAAQMPVLIQWLSQQLGRSVIDKTGLTGRYDFELKWTPAPGEFRPLGDASNAGTPPNETGPSIFTAIQEQLGLRLESARAPVETLVIDHAEKPDAN